MVDTAPAPAGTFTVILFVVALTISPRTAPKETMLYAGVDPNPDPFIVMTVPLGPFAGEKKLILICAADLIKKNCKKIKQKRVLEKKQLRNAFIV